MSESGKSDGTAPGTPPPLPADFGKPLAPVAPTERITLLDVLRGLALLGILIANINHFSNPIDDHEMRPGLVFNLADRIADFLSLVWVEDKFRSLFSILFGIGFAIQMDRAASRALNPKSTYFRRLGILMAIGLLHGIFLWDGDILLSYGACGFALVLFQNRKTLTVLIWAGALILIPAVLFLLSSLSIFFLLENIDSPTTGGPQEMIHAYASGTYVDTILYRLHQLPLLLGATLFLLPGTLGLFLIGMLIGRSRILADLPTHRQTLGKAFTLCATIGLLGNLIAATLITIGGTRSNTGTLFLGGAFSLTFAPFLCCAYISGAALLIHHKPHLPLFRPIAAAGRMALTNYLLQSLIATTLFYGYGFALGGQIGRLGTIAIALLIFTTQALLSQLWLNHHRYGPIEWLWRSLTYQSNPPKKMT
jgi:uncharacterized protein